MSEEGGDNSDIEVIDLPSLNIRNLRRWSSPVLVTHIADDSTDNSTVTDSEGIIIATTATPSK